MKAIINKYDINLEISQEIEDYLEEESIPLVEKLCFDRKFVDAMIQGKSIVEYAPESENAKAIQNIWRNLNH